MSRWPRIQRTSSRGDLRLRWLPHLEVLVRGVPPLWVRRPHRSSAETPIRGPAGLRCRTMPAFWDIPTRTVLPTRAPNIRRVPMGGRGAEAAHEGFLCLPAGHSRFGSFRTHARTGPARIGSSGRTASAAVYVQLGPAAPARPALGVVADAPEEPHWGSASAPSRSTIGSMLDELCVR